MTEVGFADLPRGLTTIAEQLQQSCDSPVDLPDSLTGSCLRADVGNALWPI